MPFPGCGYVPGHYECGCSLWNIQGVKEGSLYDYWKELSGRARCWCDNAERRWRWPSKCGIGLVKHDIGRLTVMQDGNLIGIITRSDAMRYYYDLPPG